MIFRLANNFALSEVPLKNPPAICTYDDAVSCFAPASGAGAGGERFQSADNGVQSRLVGRVAGLGGRGRRLEPRQAADGRGPSPRGPVLGGGPLRQPRERRERKGRATQQNGEKQDVKIKKMEAKQNKTEPQPENRRYT